MLEKSPENILHHTRRHSEGQRNGEMVKNKIKLDFERERERERDDNDSALLPPVGPLPFHAAKREAGDCACAATTIERAINVCARTSTARLPSSNHPKSLAELENGMKIPISSFGLQRRGYRYCGWLVGRSLGLRLLRFSTKAQLSSVQSISQSVIQSISASQPACQSVRSVIFLAFRGGRCARMKHTARFVARLTSPRRAGASTSIAAAAHTHPARGAALHHSPPPSPPSSPIL